MDKNIEQIISELFAIEPALRDHEKQVRSLIVELLRSRPQAAMDPEFAKSLHARLMAIYPTVISQSSSPRLARFFTPILAYPLAGIAVLVLMVGLLRSDTGGPSPLLQSGIVTRTLGSEAFGPLTISAGGQGGGGADSGSTAKSQSFGESGVPAPQMPSAMAVPPVMGGMGGGVGSSDLRIAPVPPTMVVYRYVYKGEGLELPETAEVYRRALGAGTEIGNLLQSFNLGLIDPATFPSAKVQSLNLMNDEYSIFVNLTEGSININENWKNIMPYPEMRMLTPGDVPPDADMIAIADAFIRDHGISRDGYGEPFVLKQNYGPIILEKGGAASAEMYVPDTQQVVYPFVLNGRPVYEEYGQQTGLTVSVNIRTRKATGVYNLLTQEYEVSNYPVERDFGRIRKILEQGGFRNYYPADMQVQTVEIGVGEPVWGMVRVWNYSDRDPQELFVPALIFPITDRPEGQYLPDRIIVPVVKSVLDQPMPGPMTMPMGGTEAPPAVAPPPELRR